MVSNKQQETLMLKTHALCFHTHKFWIIMEDALFEKLVANKLRPC